MYCQVCLDHWFPGIGMGCVSNIQQVFGVVICRLCYHSWSHDSIQLMNIVTPRIYRRLQTSKIDQREYTVVEFWWPQFVDAIQVGRCIQPYSRLHFPTGDNGLMSSTRLRVVYVFVTLAFGHTMHNKGEQKWADQTKHVPQGGNSEG